MASKRKSPTTIGLGKLVLPEKESLGNILTELHSSVNPCEVSDLILGPVYEIMGNISDSTNPFIKRGVR